MKRARIRLSRQEEEDPRDAREERAAAAVAKAKRDALKGHAVEKMFGDERHSGTVTGTYRGKNDDCMMVDLYTVTYADGDTEDLELGELKAVLKKKNGAAASSSSSPSSSSSSSSSASSSSSSSKKKKQIAEPPRAVALSCYAFVMSNPAIKAIWEEAKTEAKAKKARAK